MQIILFIIKTFLCKKFYHFSQQRIFIFLNLQLYHQFCYVLFRYFIKLQFQLYQSNSFFFNKNLYSYVSYFYFTNKIILSCSQNIFCLSQQFSIQLFFTHKFIPKQFQSIQSINFTYRKKSVYNMMEGVQQKINRLKFSKSQTDLVLNTSNNSVSQHLSRQKNVGTMSPKEKIDQILNSLNIYKNNGVKKNSSNLGRVSEIFNNDNNLSQYKQEKSFMFSGESLLPNYNSSKNHSLKFPNQSKSDKKIQLQNSSKLISSPGKDIVNSYQLNRIRSEDAFLNKEILNVKSNENSQKNILKSSSSETDLIFSVQQKKTSLQAIKEKLVKFGIKMNNIQNKQQRQASINEKNHQNHFIPICNKQKIDVDNSHKIIISGPKKSQILPEYSLDNIKEKSFISNLKQSKCQKDFNISKNYSPNNHQRIEEKRPSIKLNISTNSIAKIRSYSKQNSLYSKQIVRNIQVSKIGQPKLVALKNNKTSRIINPSKEKQPNSKNFQKQNYVPPLLNPLDYKVSNKQILDLKQTMETDYAYTKMKNKLSIDDFKLGRQIGKGKFGRVFLAIHSQTRFLCAMKIIKKETIRKQRNLQQLIRQVKIQSFLNNSNLVKMYGFFDDKESIYLLIEYCNDGQLYSQLKLKKKLKQDQAIPVIKDVSEGLNNLHSLGIIHRDIKPENVVLSFGMAKLCDFGWSVSCQNEKRQTFCGTPLYVSPQLLLGKSYDYKVDIWALGILSYELLTGKLPFQIMSEKQLKKIVTNQVEYPDQMTQNAKDFIKHLIHKNPSYRNDMETVLKHKFLIEGMEKLRNKKK